MNRIHTFLSWIVRIIVGILIIYFIGLGFDTMHRINTKTYNVDKSSIKIYKQKCKNHSCDAVTYPKFKFYDENGKSYKITTKIVKYHQQNENHRHCYKVIFYINGERAHISDELVNMSKDKLDMLKNEGKIKLMIDDDWECWFILLSIIILFLYLFLLFSSFCYGDKVDDKCLTPHCKNCPGKILCVTKNNINKTKEFFGYESNE